MSVWPFRDPRRASGGRTGLGAADQYLVHQSVLYRLFGAEEIVAVGVMFDSLHVLAGVLRHQFVEPAAQVEDLARVDFDVRGLALEAAHRLMDHDPRVGQREAL